MKLNTELNIEKNNNINLSQRIKDLEKINNIKGEQNLKEKSNTNLENEDKNVIKEKLNIRTDKLSEILEEIRIKDKIISNYPVILSEGEKLMSVIFTSLDKKVQYSVICKNSDIFNKIENILYDSYLEYRESENNYTINGYKINKYKSLEANKIKDHDIILLQNI